MRIWIRTVAAVSLALTGMAHGQAFAADTQIKTTVVAHAPAQPQAKAAPAKAAGNAAPAAGVANGLKIGEYACYGSGGRIMIGLGFKVRAGGRYTDLDGKNPGTVSVSGGMVTFRGGHLGGQQGRDLKNGNFRIGAQADCEPS